MPNTMKDVADAYRLAKTTDGEQTAHEIPEAVYLDAFSCMPQIYGQGRWWVDDPLRHDDKGRPTSLECYAIGERYFCRLSPVGSNWLKVTG